MTVEQIKQIFAREIAQLNARLREGLIDHERYTVRAEQIRQWAENAYELALYDPPMFASDRANCRAAWKQ